MSTEYVVTGTGGSKQVTSTERVQILAGIQGPSGADGTVFRWLGAWDPAVTYLADDAVYETSTGAAYLCLSTNLNDPPSAQSGNWSVLADPTVGLVNHVQSTDGEHDNFQRRIGHPLVDDSSGYFSNLSYDSATRTVSLTAAGTDTAVPDPATQIRYYRNGERVIKTGPITLQHDTAENGYFFYFDENDDFVVDTNPWQLTKHVPVTYVYWSGTEGVAYEERHTIYRDPMIHEALHFAIGTFVQSGFALSDYSLITGTPAATRWTMGPGEVRDEDLLTGVSQVGTPDYTVIHRLGTTGSWQFSRGLSDPVLVGASFVHWNEYTGATWQLTEGSNGEYINYFIFVTPGIVQANRVFVVPGQAVHASLSSAESEVLESLDMGGLIAQEIAGVWRLILRMNNSHTSAGKHSIIQVDQIFQQRSGSVTAGGPTDHQTLSGRSEIQSHPASAVEVTPTVELQNNVQDALETINTERLGHLNNTIGAHDASAIAVTPLIDGANDVQEVLEAHETEITDHIADASAAHAGSAISNTPAGSVAATDVQAAINELDGDITSHVGAGDPHSQYQLESEKGVASGYAPLDSSSEVPVANLPVAVGGAIGGATGDEGTVPPSPGGGDHGDEYVMLASKAGLWWGLDKYDATWNPDGRFSFHPSTSALTVKEFKEAGGNIPSPTGAGTYNVRRVRAAGTVTAVYALVTGGTSVTVNAQAGGLDLRSSDLVVTAGAGWVSFGTLQNTDLAAGESLSIEVVSVSGTPSEVAIQIEYELD
jgi:hypothetical protein